MDGLHLQLDFGDRSSLQWLNRSQYFPASPSPNEVYGIIYIYITTYIYMYLLCIYIYSNVLYIYIVSCSMLEGNTVKPLRKRHMYKLIGTYQNLDQQRIRKNKLVWNLLVTHF